MSRTWFMAWIYGTIAATAFCLVAGTIAIFLNSGMLGNLVVLWAVAAFASGMGLAITLGIAEVEVPPKQPRLSRSTRQALRREAERIEFDRRTAALEREAGIPRRES